MIFGSALAIVAVCNRKRFAVASVICAELQTSRTDFRNSPAICRPDCQKDRAHHEAGALEGSDRSSAALSHGGPCFRACSRDRASHPVRQHRSRGCGLHDHDRSDRTGRLDGANRVTPDAHGDVGDRRASSRRPGIGAYDLTRAVVISENGSPTQSNALMRVEPATTSIHAFLKVADSPNICRASTGLATSAPRPRTSFTASSTSCALVARTPRLR